MAIEEPQKEKIVIAMDDVRVMHGQRTTAAR